MDIVVLQIIAIFYLGVVAYLGFRGYKGTKSTSDYLVAGRKAHPFVMAMSYGATFISTAAIIGFGGAAAVFGMGLLWLTFLNIFVGILIAFTIFGGRTRTMGHRLQAHTFPELLGKRFNSRFVQAACGLIILVFMPLYAAAVLIGAARYIETAFKLDFRIAVVIFSIIIAAYVIAGGLKSVMYTDALQGTLMFIGVLILIVFTYGQLGGITTAHKALDALPGQIDAAYAEAEPKLSELSGGKDGAELFTWYADQMALLKSTATMDEAEKTAFFIENPHLKTIGGMVKEEPKLVSKLVTAKLAKGGFNGWARFPKPWSNLWYVLVTSIITGVGIGVLAQPQLAVRFMTVRSQRELNRAILVGSIFILMVTGVVYVVGSLSNVWFSMAENGGKVSLATVADGNIDLIIPTFIDTALPNWFNGIFMLTLLSAAMSTLSSQFHAMGTSIGRDFFEKGMLGTQEHPQTVLITRIGILLAIIVTSLLSFVLPPGIIAAATAIFFGLCAASFLPMYFGALFWKRMTKAGAIASLISGFVVSFFWLMFVQNVKGKLPALLAQALFDKPTLLPEPTGVFHWNWTESMFIALPVSILVAIVVSLMTQPESDEHIAKCFEGIDK